MLGRFLKHGTDRKCHRDLPASRLVEYSRNWIFDAVLPLRHFYTPVACKRMGQFCRHYTRRENNPMFCTGWRCALYYAQLKTHTHSSPNSYSTFHQFFPMGDPDSAEEHLARKYNIPPTSWLRIGVESVPPQATWIENMAKHATSLSNLCSMFPNWARQAPMENRANLWPY